MNPFYLGLGFVIWMTVFVGTMLFGDSAFFIGTPVATAHWVFTEGVCIFAWSAVEYTCGEWGTSILTNLTSACMDRPNPILQILYLAMLFVGYYLYSRDVLSLLPQPFAPLWHMYTGALAVGACLLTFMVASLSDPGTVTAANVDDHVALYDYDDVVYVKKDCWTCLRVRPARSKHCSVCQRCVARFDHHCGWINSCVGFNNTRFFLAFLGANIFLAIYGTIMACIILLGEMKRRRVWSARFRDSSGQIQIMSQTPSLMLSWLLAYHPTAVLLILVLFVALLLVGGFLGHHLWLVARGTTTYETFKWRDLEKIMALEANAEDSDSIPEPQGSESRQQSRKSAGDARGVGSPEWKKTHELGDSIRNIYDRGVWKNFAEVFWPGAALQSARKMK